MQCFHDYRRFCPKVSEEWAIDLNLSAPPPPNENLALPPMYSMIKQFQFLLGCSFAQWI